MVNGVPDAAPAMARKGRLQAGYDADITVFDPVTVIDRADFKKLVADLEEKLRKAARPD